MSDESIFAWIGRVFVAILALAIPLLFGMAIGFEWNDIIMAVLILLFSLEALLVLEYAATRRDKDV